MLNTDIWRLGKRVEWKVLETFYADVDGGPEKVEKMKRLCADADPLVGRRLQSAKVNHEYLLDRRRKLSGEVAWTDENVEKLARLDRRIRELEEEIERNAVRLKRDLGGLIASGGDVYRDYQVEAWIDYSPDDCDEEERKPPEDAWTLGLLERYLDGKMLVTVAFGEGEEPNRNEALEAWGRWTKYGYFAENGMTFYLCQLLQSLYSPGDVVEMKPEDFHAKYEVSF